MVHWMLTSVSRNSNCEIDFDYFIGVLSKIQNDATSASTVTGYEAEHQSPCNTMQQGPDNQMSNATVESSAPEICGPSQQEVQVRPACTADVATPTLDVTDCEFFGGSTDWTQLFKLGVTDDSVVCYLAGYAEEGQQLSDL